MTILEVLKAVRGLLMDPDKWCQHGFHDGEKNCILGAVSRVVGTDNDTYQRAVLALATARCVDQPAAVLSRFNDAEDTDHKAILRLIDSAIDKEGKGCSTTSSS